MSQDDIDTEAFVARQSRRMMSFAMYHKLKSIAESWDREERAKARVVAGALCGLAVWFALLVVGALLFPRYAGLLLPVGFVAWVVFVIALIRRHLGATRKGS
jgi:cobalamin biosynthesis protein CobD/CbiB